MGCSVNHFRAAEARSETSRRDFEHWSMRRSVSNAEVPVTVPISRRLFRRLLSQFVVGRLTGRLLAAPRPGLLDNFSVHQSSTGMYPVSHPTPNVLGSDRLPGKFEAPQCDFEHWPMLPSAFEPFPRRNARKRCLKRSIWLGH